MTVKTREFIESNYRAVWYNGKTIRIPLDVTKPITELQYPEFYDVKITSYCEGNCPFCYMDSKSTDSHIIDSLDKIKSFFGNMTPNQRPFQVAIGGGEPTSHPNFFKILYAFHELGIQPNYTTNGMWVKNTDIEYISNMMDYTINYCGGVAVSCHPHLNRYWESAATYYHQWGVKLNFHIIISDKESIDRFVWIHNMWDRKVDYFVLLPYGTQGRAEHKDIDWDYLVTKLPENTSKIAFGANFYPYLLKGGHNLNVSLYEPEIMSKYLDLKDMSLHKSSFNLNETTWQNAEQ